MYFAFLAHFKVWRWYTQSLYFDTLKENFLNKTLSVKEFELCQNNSKKWLYTIKIEGESPQGFLRAQNPKLG